MSVKGLIATLLLAVGSQQAARPSEADFEWLDTSWTQAFEALMPVESGFPQVVAYRTYRDLYITDHELYFAISYTPEPNGFVKKLVATITAPKGNSLQQQLLELHMKNRQAHLAALLEQVSIQRLTVTEERCPALRKQFNALRRVMLGISDPNVLIIHPTIHRLVIDQGGDKIDAEITDSNRPLVRWATDTATALRRCTA